MSSYVEETCNIKICENLIYTKWCRHLEDSLNIDQGEIIIKYRSISTIFKVTFQNHVFSKQSLPLTDKKLPTMHFKFFF